MTMRPSLSRCVALTIILLGVALAMAGGAPAQGGGAGEVWVIPVTGTIDRGLSRFITRAVSEAEAAGAAAVVIAVKTLGGRVDAALEIRDRLLASTVPVLAFVEGRAWSAGALIALACERIVMAPGSSIGAAEPRPFDAKTVSALRTEMESTAERRGRDPQLAAGMVDRNLVIPGLKGPGEILSLTAQRALSLGLVDAIAPNSLEAIRGQGFTGSVRELQPRPAEVAARFLTHPAVAPILLTVGLIGLGVELFAPGFGVPGIIAIISLTAFFGGQLVAGFAGWEVVALFLLGLVLLAVEAMIPGFGVPGVLGIAAFAAAIVLAARSGGQAVRSLVVATIASLMLGGILLKQGTRRGLWRRFALQDRERPEEGYVGLRHEAGLVGQHGTVVSPLRPAGVIEVNGRRLDVVSEGGFVAAGAKVEVVRLEGPRIVVRPVDA